jgi:hypothetical protein
MPLRWIHSETGDALCADGHPIRITRGGPLAFILHVEGRNPLPYATLAAAKCEAERITAEIDEFEGRTTG